MEIETVYQIAKREWDNISISLAECGSTGNLEFDKLITQCPILITNLYEMEIKINDYDYKTLEAGIVISILKMVYKLIRNRGPAFRSGKFDCISG